MSAKKIKVSIKDENTLVLLESANQGDIIDLRSLHDVDIDKSTIEEVVKSIKMDKFNAELKKQTEAIERENNLKLEIEEKKYAEKAKEELSKKENTIIQLHSELKSIAEKSEREAEITVLKEKQKIEEEYRKQLREKDDELGKIKHDKELSEEKLKEKLKATEEQLVYTKEMRVKMSTKMVGESLEIHCENEFNRIRSIAFPKAEFNKDNDAS